MPVYANGRLSCGLPRVVALGIFGALTKFKSAANDLPYTSQVALGLFGQCNAQASKVAHYTCVVQTSPLRAYELRVVHNADRSSMQREL